MGDLEVIARFKIRPGRLEGFEAQVGEILRVTREQDAHTLRCDWFVDDDGTECEVHEVFPSEQGLIEHKMHTMEATEVLFRDDAFDHRSTVYGEVSQDFLDLVSARMGAAPTVFSFLQGLGRPATVSPHGTGRGRSQGVEGATSHLEVHAHLKIRPGQLEAFEAQAAEILRLVRDQDTQTTRYDWFVSDDGTECEVHEAYLGEEGLIEHTAHVVEARALLFEKYAFDHRMSVFGEISPHLREMFAEHAGGVRSYTFLQGLETGVSV